MRKMIIFIIAGLLIIAAVIYFRVKPKGKTAGDGYFIATQGQSKQRVQSLDLDKPSENASYILDTAKLSFPKIKTDYENKEYKADPGKEWVINLVPVNGDMFKKEDFMKMFDGGWRTKFASTIYGFSPEENRWTFADAGRTPEIYSKLQIAVDVQGIYNDEKPDYDPKKLERYLIELEKRIKTYPVKLRLEHPETIESAIAKAKNLVALYNQFNNDAIIVLQSDTQFSGMAIWDALQSVGLTWGDGDLFHWNNDEDYGDQAYFSVWTTTKPGYFLPEQVKAGNLNPKDLVFGFSIPRSADPANIYAIMMNAVKYCQKRLGGQLLTSNMQPLNEGTEKQRLANFIKQMEDKGIKPGSNKALQMF